MPEVGEPELVRHFTNLSRRNFSVDTNFYPLGSCTMKYNPKALEKAAGELGLNNIRIDFTGCHGFCEQGPVVFVEPEDIFYTHVAVADVLLYGMLYQLDDA